MALPGLPSGEDKRYRECMAEIIGVLKKHDMAGAVTVVSKERAMFKYHFPTWTAVELKETSVRLRLKGSEFENKKAARDCAELTAHVIMQMGDCAANTMGHHENRDRGNAGSHRSRAGRALGAFEHETICSEVGT